MPNKMPNQNLNFLYVFVLICFVLISPLMGRDGQNEKIVEKVTVENIIVPVRVFDGDKPVEGLKKENFQLLVNGKPCGINGFYQSKKNLKLIEKQPGDKPETAPAPAPSPRLFVLIFSITDFKMDISGYIDTLFGRVIRPRDRIIIISNRFIFPEWVVVSPKQTEKKVQEILRKETEFIKRETTRYEAELRILQNDYYSKMKDPTMVVNPSVVYEDFFLNYQFIMEDIRASYLNLPVEHYIKISHYLKGLDMDKWVLNFYEIGRMPFLLPTSEILKKAQFYDTATEDQIMESYSSELVGMQGRVPEDPSVTKSVIRKYLFQYKQEILHFDNMLLKDINKSFLNSGATFHTLLLNPLTRTPFTDFNYQKITTEGESILKTIARDTGGSVVTSNKIDDFLEDVAAKEDIIYVMTYVPSIRDQNAKLEIRVKDDSKKKLRAVFDNLRRKKSFLGIARQMQKNKKHLLIDGLLYKNNMLSVKLKNIELVDFEGDSFGAVRVRIKILDGQKNVVKRFEKTFKGIKQQGEFLVPLPKLQGSDYRVVVEVKDLFALNGVYTGDAININ